MNRRGDKRVGAVREISPSPIKITRERIGNISEQIMVIYIWKSMEKVIYIWKIKLSRP